MFHKIASGLGLLVNSGFVGISVFYYFIYSCAAETLQYLSMLSAFLQIFVCIVLLAIASLVFVWIAALKTNVAVGKPPVGNFVFAYKYGLSNSLTSSEVKNAYRKFLLEDKMQISYEGKVDPFGIAYGAVTHYNSGQVNEDLKAYTDQHGFRLLQAKEIINALHISCPKPPWLFFIGTWLILMTVYPKFYKYSKKHRLSAYPVIELDRWCCVDLVAPLSQQDNFVVPEALALIQRSSSSISIYLDSAMNISLSTNHSSTHEECRGVLKEIGNNNVTNVDPLHTSARKLLNGKTKKKDHLRNETED